jgi:hypothetical protein
MIHSFDGTTIADNSFPMPCGSGEVPNASETPVPPPAVVSANVTPATLVDILRAADKARGPTERMLHTVGNLLSEFFQGSFETITLCMIRDDRDRFRSFLADRKLTPNSVKSYIYYLDVILRRAEKLGWVYTPPRLPADWQLVADLLKRPATMRIVRFAVRLGVETSEFSEDHLEEWIRDRVSQNQSRRTAASECSHFRQAISAPGTGIHLPLIKPQAPVYGVKLANMHPGLRGDIEKIIEWKTCDYNPDRHAKAHIRKVSAEHLLSAFIQIEGYRQNIKGFAPTESLAELITPSNLRAFVMWKRNVRKNSASGIIPQLGMLVAVLNSMPDYKEPMGRWAWLSDLVKTLDPNTRADIDTRKAKKLISYEAAKDIPKKIREDRGRHLKAMSPFEVALSIRNELLTQWLIVLPWRQRNMREARIGGPSPNIFREALSDANRATRPLWVQKQEKMEPGSMFWQLRFSSDETKTGNAFRAFLPLSLISLLEEYLSLHRPVLLRGRRDPFTLLLNKEGTPLDEKTIGTLIKQLATQYAGKPLTPHLYRDVVAYHWLLHHPEDFLSLSKLLWHKTVDLTISIYGSQFNESTGIARFDDWLNSQEALAS